MRGVVRVVTGGGKTIFAELCMARFSELRSTPRFVVVVPTHALLDQWYVSFREDLGLTERDVAIFPGATPKTTRLVNLAIINSARRDLAAKSSQLPGMLIVDECHRSGSPANARALAGQYVAALGLSATPEREYDDGFERHISPALGSVVYNYDLNQARGDGVVTPFALVNVRVPMLPDEEREYMKLSRRIVLAAKRRDADSGPSGDALKRLLRQRARVSARASYRVPTAVRLVEQHRGSRCLVFHEEIEQAEAILRLLKERRHTATIYHSQLSPAVRQDNLRLFRRGVFDVLVSCRALDEGVNVPEACVAVVASGTASTRQRVQRLGRVLRPAQGKTGAVIYTIYAANVEERRLRAEAERLTTADSVEWTRVGGTDRA